MVVLYSMPNAVTELQPLAVMDPPAEAVVVVTAEEDPVTTVGSVLIPVPVTATLIGEDTPPPLTGIFPLYDCTAVGVN